MSNFSKSFGLTFINDDHFFSRVAIFQGFSNGLCRIVWGYSYDKIGFKKCFIIIGSAVTLGTTILPLLPLLGHTVPAQAGYASVMVLLYGAFPGIYAIVAAAVADAFGHLHYKANFGLLFTQAVAYSAALLVATQVMPPPERETEKCKSFRRFQSFTRLWDTPVSSWWPGPVAWSESSTTASSQTTCLLRRRRRNLLKNQFSGYCLSVFCNPAYLL